MKGTGDNRRKIRFLFLILISWRSINSRMIASIININLLGVEYTKRRKRTSNEGSEWQESLNIYNTAIIFLLSEQSSFRDVSCMLVSDQSK